MHKIISLIDKKNFTEEELNENSWVVISIESDKNPVIFYTSVDSGLSEFDNFNEFAEYYIDEVSSGKLQKLSSINNDSSIEVQRVNSYIEDDVSINNKIIEVATTNAQIIKCFKSGISLSNLEQIIKNLTQQLKSLEHNHSEATLDANDLSSDPHKYYGLNKKNFF